MSNSILEGRKNSGSARQIFLGICQFESPTILKDHAYSVISGIMYASNDVEKILVKEDIVMVVTKCVEITLPELL